MKRSVLLPLFAIVLITACGKKTETTIDLSTSAVVAEKIPIWNDSIIVVDVPAIKDTIIYPLSNLLSSFEVIPLENSEEALTAFDGRIFVSDNYMGVYSFRSQGYRLFDRKGKYLTTISSVGQGPDEYYIAIYDSFIDEENDKIYLLSIRANKLLVFDLNGKPQTHIPLPYVTHKGRFIVDPEKQQLIMLAMPFPDTPSAVWVQDFDGNVIQEIPAGHFVIKPSDYSNELWESLNTGQIDFSIELCLPKQDTIYHYQPDKNILKPVLTTDPKWDIIPHNYIELPHHYLMWLINKTTWGYEYPRFPKILVEKETGRGAYVDIWMDMLGDIPGPNKISFSRGYFTAIMDSDQLKEQLAKALLRKNNYPKEMVEKMTSLDEQLTDDDNNIVFIGKLKIE